jgi:hypothetical protein
MSDRYFYYGRDWGDKMDDGNGTTHLTVYHPRFYPEKFSFMLTGSEISAFVGAYSRGESRYCPENTHHNAILVSRTDGDVHELRFVTQMDTRTIALTDHDLALLGVHAQISADLSARELLSWRERHPRTADISRGTSPTDAHA